ncbi:hypothetical protein [Streptomyces sp. NPDC002845]
MTADLHVCRYCDGLTTEEAPGRRIAYEPGASGPGLEVWARLNDPAALGSRVCAELLRQGARDIIEGIPH